jgi:hypothetical protein
VNYVDYLLTTDIMAYEFQNSFGATVGFSFGGTPVAVGASLNMSDSQVTMQMATSSIENQASLVNSSSGTADANSLGLTGNVSFAEIASAGFNYYSTTAVSTLTLAGLQNTFKNLMSNLSTYEKTHTWQSKVISVPDDESNTVIIQAGQMAGVQKGDTFIVYNTIDDWAGTPCNSTFYNEYPSTSAPIATLTVISVNDFTSVLQVEGGVTASQIEPGAIVQVSALVPAAGGKARAPLGRSIAILSTTSGTLTIDGVTNVGIQGYAQLQLADVISMNATSNRYYLSTLPTN